MSKIALATGDDVEELIALNQQVLALHASLYPGYFKHEADPAELRALFASTIADAAHAIAVQRTSEQVEGYVWLELQERPETALTPPSRRVYVHHIVVADTSRRRGVGSALMRWVEHYAAARGIGRIVLDHWAANETAQAFFARCGFSPVKMVVRKDVAQG